MTHTESFGRGRIAESILDDTSVPFTLKVSKIPIEENQYITIDPDTNNEEILFYTTKAWTIGEAGTINITWRGFNAADSNVNVLNQREHDENSEYKLALNHIIINDKVDKSIDNDITANIEFSGNTAIGLNWVNNLTTAERDALSANNGALIYNVDTNVIQQYVSGAWTDVGNTGTPDASETVAGKVEMATQAQYDAKTDIGETGAKLIPQMGQMPVTATETVEGLVEKATDGEVIAGTDNVNYTTPKQWFDNYVLKTQTQIITRNQSTASGTVQYNHTLWVVPKLIKFHAILATNQWSDWAYDGTTNNVVWATGTPWASTNSTYSIRPDAATNHTTWLVTAMTSTTFDVTWVRILTPTSTFVINTTLIA